MSSIIDGIVKGVAGLMPQDDPDVKIFNAQSELKDFSKKEEMIYARLGKQVYETDGGESYPEIKAELDLLTANRQAAEGRLKAAREEKAARERAETEAAARREAEEAARSCPNCGAYNPEGTNFCQECGSRLAQPMQQAPAAKRFCPNCGTEIAARPAFLQRLRCEDRVK